MINSFTKARFSTCLLAIGCLVVGLQLCACQSPTLEPQHRPPSVPNDAIWVGGADGGAYVRCGIDLARNVNPCSVWNDHTGVLVESGDYRLVKDSVRQMKLNCTLPFRISAV